MRPIIRRIVLAAFTVIVALAAWVALAPLPAALPGALDGKHNAVWLGPAWFRGAVTPAARDALLGQLAAHDVRDVYVYVGRLDARGLLPGGPPEAWADARSRLKAKGLRLFAWMRGATRGSQGTTFDVLDTSDARVRAGLRMTARALLDVGHFDGIHYDLDGTPSGDEGLPALLDETRTACGSAPISVATPNLRPPWLLVQHLWTRAYYAEVAQRCDQIVVMAWDTGLPTAAAYSRFLAWEANALAATLPPAKLVMGVSTDLEATRSHRPAAETLAAALHGLALSGGSFSGVAVHGDWTTTPEDWARLPQSSPLESTSSQPRAASSSAANGAMRP